MAFHDQHRQGDAEHRAGSGAGPRVLAGGGAAALGRRGLDAVDEVDQHGLRPAGTVGVERLVGELGGLARRQTALGAAGPELLPSQDGVDARPAERLGDLARHGAGVAAALVERRLRQDGHVDRHARVLLDVLAQFRLLSDGQLLLGRVADVHRVVGKSAGCGTYELPGHRGAGQQQHRGDGRDGEQGKSEEHTSRRTPPGGHLKLRSRVICPHPSRTSPGGAAADPVSILPGVVLFRQ